VHHTGRIEIFNSKIQNNDGSGIDIYNVDDGMIHGNDVTGNSQPDGFAGISMVDASGWLVEGNVVNNPGTRGKSACHDSTQADAVWNRPTAILLCSYLRNSTGNRFVENAIDSPYYGILLNGVTSQSIAGNTVSGTLPLNAPVGCADHGGAGANTWAGQDCQHTGSVDSPPYYI
jgi:parallel beta-helix repeat protein